MSSSSPPATVVDTLLARALLCGGLPLVVGIAIFTAWWFSPDDALAVMGLCNVLGGLAAFFYGTHCLLRAMRVARESAVSRERRFRRTAVAAALLLLVNFPVALYAMTVGIREQGQFHVLIRNDSDQPLRDVQISSLGLVDLQVPEIAPHSVTRWSFDLAVEGPVRFSSTIHGAPWNDETLSGYESPGAGGRAELTIPAGANAGSSGP